MILSVILRNIALLGSDDHLMNERSTTTPIQPAGLIFNDTRHRLSSVTSARKRIPTGGTLLTVAGTAIDVDYRQR